MEVMGKDMYLCFWSKITNIEHKHKCNLCLSDRIQNRAHGYKNLFDHLDAKHKDWKEIYRKYAADKVTKGPIDKYYVQASDKAKNIHRWIEWIIDDNLPLNFCEKKCVRKNTNLQNISVNTLKKYMKLLQMRVRNIIGEMLPKTFGLLIDGWTMDSDHYSGIYATFMQEEEHHTWKVVQVLLSCNVADDFDEETEFEVDLPDNEKLFGFTAADWFDSIVDVLNGEYGMNITADNACDTIEFIIGDNCSTNRKLSNDSGIPLVGCASHRLHLAVCELIGRKKK